LTLERSSPLPPAGHASREPSRFAPAPGCFIFVIGGLLLAAAAIWAIFTFSRQVRELAAFTEPARAPIEVRPVTIEETAALRNKLAAFAKAVDAGQAPSLSLDADEVNTLLAGFDAFAEIRSLMAIERIEDGRLAARISFPMNTLPGKQAWLNGNLFFKPAARRDVGFHVITEDITVPGKTVPPGFIDLYRQGVIPGKSLGFLDDMLVRNFRQDRTYGPYLQKIEKVTIADGTFTVTASPGPPKPFGE
jgi:hypothetical protein